MMKFEDELISKYWYEEKVSLLTDKYYIVVEHDGIKATFENEDLQHITHERNITIDDVVKLEQLRYEKIKLVEQKQPDSVCYKIDEICKYDVNHKTVHVRGDHSSFGLDRLKNFIKQGYIVKFN